MGRGSSDRDQIVELIGGQGDAEVTDNIRDYYLPEATRNRLPEIEQLNTYNEFADYLRRHYGVELDTSLGTLSGAKANDSIPAVIEQCRKIITAIDAYRETFGHNALSALKKVVLYSNHLDKSVAYFRKNDPLAGQVHFRQWGNTGYQIFHELGHAYQDSHKRPGEDAATYSARIVDRTDSSELTAYFGASDSAYPAEQMADALGYGFSMGTRDGIEFIRRLQRADRRR